VGADLLNAKALREGNHDKIISAARELVNAVAAARTALGGAHAGKGTN
jgi:hypothetical protein